MRTNNRLQSILDLAVSIFGSKELEILVSTLGLAVLSKNSGLKTWSLRDRYFESRVYLVNSVACVKKNDKI
jgi:hypothetical protein